MSQLDRLMRQVLAEMSVLADARASRTGGDIVHGGDPDNSPHGESQRIMDEHVYHYNNAHSHTSRKAVFMRAHQDLKNTRRMRLPVPEKDPEPLRDSPQWKRWVGNHPLPAAELARQYGVSRQYISRLKAQYKEET